jgi:ParB family chromosome partitioning protein
MSTRHNAAQVLSEAAAAYKVDTEAIAVKVKQEFAAKAKPQVAKKGVAEAQSKAVKKTKAA